MHACWCVSVSVHVCVSVSMYICPYVCTPECVYLHKSMHSALPYVPCVYMHVLVGLCVSVCFWGYVSIRICDSVSPCTFLCTAFMCVCVSVCSVHACLCTYVCDCVLALRKESSRENSC
jgi:hypothetical protein